MNQELTKKCSHCHEIKPITEYYKRKSKKDGYEYQCKKCESTRRIKRYNKYKEKELDYQHKRYINNPEYFSNYQKNNRLKNEKRDKEYRIKYKKLHPNYKRDWARTQRKNNPNYNLRHNLRNRITMGRKNNQKCGHSLDLLGHTITEDNQWIKSQFYNGMTWKKQGNGHGKWQIHHICPLEYFDLTNPVEQKQAIFYTNTQPLWYEDHVEEHRKINERMSQYENNGKPM